jgi:putative effector of murein hydrolase
MNHEKIVSKSYTQNFLHIDYRDYIQVSYVYTILLVLGLLLIAHIIAFRVETLRTVSPRSAVLCIAIEISPHVSGIN